MPFERLTPNHVSGNAPIPFYNPATFPISDAQETNLQPQQWSNQAPGNFAINQQQRNQNNWNADWNYTNIQRELGDYTATYSNHTYVNRVEANLNHNQNLNANLQTMNNQDAWNWGDSNDAWEWGDWSDGKPTEAVFSNLNAAQKQENAYSSNELNFKSAYAESAGNNNSCDIYQENCDNSNIYKNVNTADNVYSEKSTAPTSNAVNGCEIGLPCGEIEISSSCTTVQEVISDVVTDTLENDVNERPPSAWSNASNTSYNSYQQRVQGLEEEIDLQTNISALGTVVSEFSPVEGSRQLLGAESDAFSDNAYAIEELKHKSPYVPSNNIIQDAHSVTAMSSTSLLESERLVQGEISQQGRTEYFGETRNEFLQNSRVANQDSHESGDGAFDIQSNFHPVNNYYQPPSNNPLDFAGDGESCEDRIVPGIDSDSNFTINVPSLTPNNVSNTNLPMRNTPPVREETMGGSDSEKDRIAPPSDILHASKCDNAVPCESSERIRNGNNELSNKANDEHYPLNSGVKLIDPCFSMNSDSEDIQERIDKTRGSSGDGSDETMNKGGSFIRGGSHWSQDDAAINSEVKANKVVRSNFEEDRKSNQEHKVASSRISNDGHYKLSDQHDEKAINNQPRNKIDNKRDRIDSHGSEARFTNHIKDDSAKFKRSSFERNDSMETDGHYRRDPQYSREINDDHFDREPMGREGLVKDDTSGHGSHSSRSSNIHSRKSQPHERHFKEDEYGYRDHSDRPEDNTRRRHGSSDRFSDSSIKGREKFYRSDEYDRRSNYNKDLDTGDGVYDRKGDVYQRGAFQRREDIDSRHHKYNSPYDSNYSDRGHRDDQKRFEKDYNYRKEYDGRRGEEDYYNRRKYDSDKDSSWQQYPSRQGGDGYYDGRNPRKEYYESYRDGDKRRESSRKDGNYYRMYEEDSYRDDRSRPVSRTGSTYEDAYYRDPRSMVDPYDRYRTMMMRREGYDYYNKRGGYPYMYDPYQYYYDYYKRMTQSQVEELKRTNPQAYNAWYRKYYGHLYADPNQVHNKSGRSSVNEDSEQCHTSSADPPGVNERIEQSFQVINQETAIQPDMSGYYIPESKENYNEYSDYNYALNEASVSTHIESPVVKHRMTPAKFISPHIHAKFTPNGKILKVLPHNPQEGKAAQIEIVELQDILGDSPDLMDLQSYPGPLLRGETHKNNVIEFINLKLRKIKESLDLVDSDSSALLWEYLLLSIRQNGTVVGSDVAELLLERKNVYTRKSSRQGSIGSIEGETTISSLQDKMDRMVVNQQENDKDIINKFKEYLLYGHKKNALEWAMKHGLWGHALFLSSKMDTRTQVNVMTRFTSALPPTDPLLTLYQLMAGRQPAAVTCCLEDKWGNWHPHLAMILSNPSNRPDMDQKSIITLGDTLASKGLLYAAQFCYLMAKVNFGQYSVKTSKLVLLGASTNLPFDMFATNEAIQCTEVYEYSQALANSDFVLPHLQGYKLIYANRLLDHGLSQDALRYCEVISYAICGAPSLYNRNLIQQVTDLANKLKYQDPYYSGGECDTEEMEDPPWLVSLRAVAQDSQLTFPAERINQAESYYPLSEPAHQLDSQFNYPTQDVPEQGISQPLMFNVNSVQTSVPPQNKNIVNNDMSQPPMSQPWSLPYETSYSEPQLSQQDYNSLQLHQTYSQGGYNYQESADAGLIQDQNPDAGFDYWDNSARNNAYSQENDYGAVQSEIPKPDETAHTPTDKNSISEDDKQNKKEDKEIKKPKGSGWLGGIMDKFSFKPKNQMILPDDKNPSIVWDDDRKCWKNTSGVEDDGSSGPKAPPKDFELTPNQPKMPLPTMPSGGNKFKLQKGMKSNYVDVFNPNKSSTSTPKYPDVIQPAFINQTVPSPFSQDPYNVDQDYNGNEQENDAVTPVMMDPSQFIATNHAVNIGKQRRLYPR